MRAFIQSTQSGVPKSQNYYIADQGFREMGIETAPFFRLEELSECRPDDVVVGGIGSVTHKLNAFGINVPEINYPEELSMFLGRRIWQTTIDQILNNHEIRPVFIKPIRAKRFAGMVLRTATDCPRMAYCEENEPVYCSEVIDFQAEWRVFVRYGKIIDVRPYFGDWRKHYDYRVIERAVYAFRSDPAGYAIDFGVTNDERTLMIEVNDGFALGSYGLAAINYAKLLSARWSELVGIHDDCDTMFDGYEWKKRKRQDVDNCGCI